jgi:hypothetical protein
MTNLPNSGRPNSTDNVAVTKEEFRGEMNKLLQYLAQTLGGVVGTYSTEAVDPGKPKLTGTPELVLGAEPLPADSSQRLPTTAWVRGYVTKHVADEIAANPPFRPGVTTVFYQAAAPVGWTRLTTHNDKALRIVSSGGGSASPGGGAFSTVFANRTVPLVDHTHHLADPGHTHGVGDPTHHHGVGNTASDTVGGGAGGKTISYLTPELWAPFGSDWRATGIGIHGAATGCYNFSCSQTGYATGNTMDFAVAYLDLILCSKD